MLELLSVLNYVNFIIFLKSMFSPFEETTSEGFLDLHSLLRKLTIPLSKRRLNFDNIKLILWQSNLLLQVERGYCFGIWQAVDDSSRAENGEVR